MKALVWATLGLWFVMLVNFLYSGISTIPSEGDSLAYHIPISTMISTGKWMEPEAFEKPFFFYPAMGETLLSGITDAGIPENLFNVIGWTLLGFVIYGLSMRARLGRTLSLSLAVACLMWPSMVRLLNNQTVDIWVAVWWTASVYWLEKKGKMSVSGWMWQGVFLGMLCGTKVSGILFAVVLLVVYMKKWTAANFRQLIVFATAILIVGGFWYIRNTLLTGNPFYPATILGWQGSSNFHLMDWSPWKTLFIFPGGWRLFAEALISEFLMWPIILFSLILIRSRWILLGGLNFLVYLFLPSWPANMLSDLRYLFVAFIPLMIGVWSYAKRRGHEEMFLILTVMSVAVEFTQLDFRPKIFVMAMAIPVIGWYWYKTK